MRAIHEVDLGGQTFHRIPSGLRRRDIIPVQRYHSGTYDFEDPQFENFKILVVNRAEAKVLKRNQIPVSELTDLNEQLHRQDGRHVNARERKRINPVGFVQNTEGARNALKSAGFNRGIIIYRVTPDHVAAANY